MKLVILSTPRTGSNALCQCLTFGQTLGKVDAYFVGYGADMPQSFDERDATLKANNGYNGNYATKIMWDYLDDMAKHMKRDAFVANWLYDFDRVLWLYREDKVAQAVSWFFALGDGQWHSDDKPKREPRDYNYRQIAHHLGMIEGHNARTKTFVETSGMDYLTVTYEQLAQSWTDQARRIFFWLGLHPTELKEPTYRKQHNPLKTEYINRFRHDMVRAKHGTTV